MHLNPPPDLSADDIEIWRRSPVTKWLLERSQEELSRLFWDRLSPDNQHELYRFQGAFRVLKPLAVFIKGEQQ